MINFIGRKMDVQWVVPYLIMSNIFMTKLKLENDVVVPTNPQLYKRYVADIIA